jgi:hypothetical protein
MSNFVALRYYIAQIENKITKLPERFFGSIKVQFNFRDGHIANINLDVSESIKQPNGEDDKS